ncbi:dipeptidylpeptidase [Phytophthora pseudosyringae]|uniref:Dipeptidylpeptidase n=1 Tax=Phytophthora pseudosyringae TaxID=221518 RepID=A0A8T1VX97_9STRA|nr:dipeptidylpeptidase [Phytophthora pseudosyringae]
MNQRQPDPHAPESQPTRQGRRLIRLLFRSGPEDGKALNGETSEQDCRAEDAVPWKQPTNYQPDTDKDASVPAPASKFASLKRKLFPSQNRRHPRHVPPLFSPISAPIVKSLPPLGENLKSLSCGSTSRGNDVLVGEQNQTNSESTRERDVLKLSEPDSQEETPESDFSAEGDNNWGTRGRRTLIDDDDDRDLESAVEALDLESSVADKTLEEMSRVIDDLRAWKEAHEQATQEAFSKLQAEQELQPHTVEPAHEDPTKCDDSLLAQLALKFTKQQRDREGQTLELRKEAEAYQLECGLFGSKLDESDATRVEEALQDSSDLEGLTLLRLRNELFQLDVKQRQEDLLQELQGADTALDMNFVDVQAFTGELDAILAQFDSAECLG